MYAASDLAFSAISSCARRHGVVTTLVLAMAASTMLGCGTDPADGTVIATPDTVSDDTFRVDANVENIDDEPDIPVVSLDSLLGDDLFEPIDVFLSDDTSTGEFGLSAV